VKRRIGNKNNQNVFVCILCSKEKERKSEREKERKRERVKERKREREKE
jgi:hypothetical protein